MRASPRPWPLLACAAALAACAAPPRPSDECAPRYEALSDEHQRAVRAWAAEVDAARSPAERAAHRDRGAEITREFLARFEELAERAEIEVADFQDFREDDFDRLTDELGINATARVIE